MAKRSWTIPADEYGEIDREELVERLLDLVTCVCTVGGAAMFGVDRQEIEPGRFVNMGVYAEYNTFVQARHLPQEEEAHDADDPGEEPGEDSVPDGQVELEPEREPAVTLE